MTITSASSNHSSQHYDNSLDFSSVTSSASLDSIISDQPTVSPETIAPEQNNHLMLKAALAGAALAVVAPFAVSFVGKKIAKGVVKSGEKSLPQAGGVTSHLVKSDIVQGGIEKVVKATVSKVAGEKAGKAAGKLARNTTEKIMDKKSSQNKESASEKHKKQEEKSEARQEKQSKAREEAKPEVSSNKKPDFQSSSQSAAGDTATPLKGNSGEGFQFKPDQSSNTKFSQHKNKSGEYDFRFKGTDTENRKQYFKLSRELHPDKNPNDPEATKAFQALSNAFEKSKEKK